MVVKKIRQRKTPPARRCFFLGSSKNTGDIIIYGSVNCNEVLFKKKKDSVDTCSSKVFERNDRVFIQNSSQVQRFVSSGGKS